MSKSVREAAVRARQRLFNASRQPSVYQGEGTEDDPIILDPTLADIRERVLKMIRRRIRIQQQAQMAQDEGSESQGSTSGVH